MKQKKNQNKPKSIKPTMCPHAKSTDQYHGWECTIAGGECAYLVPMIEKQNNKELKAELLGVLTSYAGDSV